MLKRRLSEFTGLVVYLLKIGLVFSLPNGFYFYKIVPRGEGS